MREKKRSSTLYFTQKKRKEKNPGRERGIQRGLGARGWRSTVVALTWTMGER